jgi:phosphate transport system ATP-binding protein
LGRGAGAANCCWNFVWNSTLYLKTQKGQEKGKIMTNSQFQLESKDINVWFGERQVLKDVSLQFPSNKVTALIGPSGCGKSTFIRTLNRMHELIPGAGFAGEVLLEGEDIYGQAVDPVDVRVKIGMVFQKPNPFPTMSIKENVISGLKLSGISRGDAGDLVEQSLVRASMWNEVKDRLNDPAVSLSGGQQQRLCIARGVAIKPEVLLLDEPCSALDPISTAKIEELIVELKADYTVLIVTHNMQQASRSSDYTAFMYLGRLIEYGPTTEIFTKPVLRETEAYVTGRFG